MASKIKTTVFIDGSNTYFAQKKMGKWLDWVKDKKKIYFFASKKTLAWELRQTCDKFFYLEDLTGLTKEDTFVRI